MRELRLPFLFDLIKDEEMVYENPETSTLLRVFRKYKINARRRDLEFELTFEEFTSIAVRNCFYCDREPRFITLTPKSKRGAYISGIDRYDSSVGYTLSNSRPCCSSCNYLKGKLHGKDFLGKIELIYKRIYRHEN